jgi:hypothetical protein
MRKTIQNFSLAAVIMAVFCAGTVSARQLQKKSNLLPACTGTCSATKPCNGACICQILTGTSGACVRDPGPVRPTHQPEPR